MNTARHLTTHLATLVAAAALIAACGTGSPGTYTIDSGDTLSGIADRSGVPLADVIAANAWTDGSNHLIIPGDVIKLPSGANPTPPEPSESVRTATRPATAATAPGSSPAADTGDAPSGKQAAPCDALVIIEAIGDPTVDYADAWCENGWAWMNPNNYGEVPTPSILKSQNGVWVLQDRTTVCDPATSLPWPVPAYCND